MIEFRHGTSPENSKQKMPGLQKFSNVTLKRGVFKSDSGYIDWNNTVMMNTIERRDVMVSLLNEEHEPVVIGK